MSAVSAIEWTDSTWPVVQGCSYESPGCTHCYAVSLIWRMAHNPDPKISKPLKGLVRKQGDKILWTGKIALREDRLAWPLGWRRPRRIFVPSHGDLFHPDVPDDFIDKVFAVMALCPQHTFQVLTKRAARMRAYIADCGNALGRQDKIRAAIVAIAGGRDTPGVTDAWVRSSGGPTKWRPLRNLHVGVSAERQAEAEARIPDLLATPAAKRFVSLEPLLAPIDLQQLFNGKTLTDAVEGMSESPVVDMGERLLAVNPEYWTHPRLDWVIAGGESGPAARPPHPHWFTDLRDSCAQAGVPFFFKQWGAWAPIQPQPEGHFGGDLRSDTIRAVTTAGASDGPFTAGDALMRRVGKKAAGAVLDGREYREMPA